MKKQIITILAGALFALAAQAQNIITLPTAVIYNSVNSNMPANTLAIDCSKQQNIAVEWTLTINGAGTDACTLSFYPQAIPGTRATTPHINGFEMTIAANGTTPVVVCTNFAVKGWARLDVGVMNNGVAGLATNVIKYAVKPNAP